VLPEGKGDVYLIRLMGWEDGATVIEGSSADYPIDVIKRDFAEAFPKGTRMRANHDGICESGGDIRRIMAKTNEAAWAGEDGMYAHARIAAQYSEFAEEFFDVIGTSISAGCEIQTEAARDDQDEIILDEDGKPEMIPKRSERGAVIVGRFLSMSESPYNSVDFVEAPGADGRIVARAVESAKVALEHFTIREAATFAKGTVKPAQENSPATPLRSNEEDHMTPEERAALTAEITESVRSSVLEAIRPVESAPEQPTLADLSEAVIAAGLTEAGRAEVYARLERGEALEGALAAETTREAAIEAEVQRRVEAATAVQASEGSFGFGFTTDDTTGAKLGTESAKSSASLDEEFNSLVGMEA